MASVRLHHPLYASCNYVVELPWQKNASTDACNACSQPFNPVVHEYKSIHLRLDDDGNVFVAEGIHKLLQRVPGMAGLEVVPGRNAPPQFVGAIEKPTEEIILADRVFYVPGHTKYQARDRMQKPFEPLKNMILEKIDRKQTAKKAEKSSTFILGKRRD